MRSTSRRAVLMTQTSFRRGTIHARVVSSAGSNLPINCRNIRKVGGKADVMPNRAIEGTASERACGRSFAAEAFEALFGTPSAPDAGRLAKAKKGKRARSD